MALLETSKDGQGFEDAAIVRQSPPGRGNVRNVYGDPVNVGGRTVIPIARVSYG